MNETVLEDKSKNKTVGRISRLFQKKSKKKSISSSTSTLSLSDPALSKQTNYPSSSSIASSQQSVPPFDTAPNKSSSLESRSIGPPAPAHQVDNASVHSKLTRNMSISSNRSVNIQHILHQQRQLLNELDAQKAMYSSDVAKLSDQLEKTQEKIQSRTHDMDNLKNNYQLHLRSVRSSDDDANSIGNKLLGLRKSIHELASELVPHAEPNVTTERLSTLWLNLNDSIEKLGKPLTPPRIQMLTEKFMMDVLVQNLNINIFPGLSCNAEFLEVSTWFEQNDTSVFFSTRLRQELSMLVVQNKEDHGSDIEQTWKKCVDRNWHHLYRGLQKAYPNYLLSSKRQSIQPDDPNAIALANEYGKKLRKLVEEAIYLGSAIKGQEQCITAMDVKEGVQKFSPNLMDDDDKQTEGIVAFCISPPFVVKVANRYEPLVKGRVLCFPSPNIPTTN